MKKLVSVVLLVVLCLGALAPQAAARSDAPIECFAPGYASWAGPMCDFYILCFILYVCGNSPPTEQAVTPADGTAPPNAKSLAPGDADGTSG